jgi:aflatoxin B1 aldehyde reductase
MLCHSMLSDADGLLLGASSLDQLEANLKACETAGTKPLPDELRTAFDVAWNDGTRAEAFPYWRSYSADMPDRESRPIGASYAPKGPK